MEKQQSHGLVVDVGMHDGADTAFYLAKGFDVLAVEADPDLVAAANERFATEIQAGRLTVLPIALTTYEGETDFYVSSDDTWSSTKPEMAQRGYHGMTTRKITVPCTTLAKVLSTVPTPHYVKIDIEGGDADCIRSLGEVAEKPRYVSFEANMTDPAEVGELVDLLAGSGFDRFKFVNQAKHPTLRLPFPAVEGDYVDAHFTKGMSGPFGEETPGQWLTRDEILDLYHDLQRRQAIRIQYSYAGRVFGIPVTGIHKQLRWLYNTRPVSRVRSWYAGARGVEVGGWFDLHAARTV